jgi:hypothetical protein
VSAYRLTYSKLPLALLAESILPADHHGLLLQLLYSILFYGLLAMSDLQSDSCLDEITIQRDLIAASVLAFVPYPNYRSY